MILPQCTLAEALAGPKDRLIATENNEDQLVF